MNRVLLLSDGLANQGLTDPNAIAIEVKTASQRGVGTTTLGLGDDYNEDLLEAMARAGDGNYYYVESPVQLADLFQTELQGLMATLGRNVRLAVRPAEGVILGDVLNDLQHDASGALVLSNLIVGMPILVFLRLTVPARSEAGPLCALTLSWDSREGGPRREMVSTYVAPEVMPLEWWAAMPEDVSVIEQEVLLMSARAQKEAAEATRLGNYSESRGFLDQAEQILASGPRSAGIAEERESVGLTRSALDGGEYLRMMKRAKNQAYLRSQSRPIPPESPKPPEA
jgi:Ca-activated chloride channel family protein